MNKEAIIKKIKALAEERGGHVSFDVFIEESGITAQWLRGQEWFRGWNNLLTELGLRTRNFGTPRTPPMVVATAVAKLIVREGCWPKEDDLRREKKRDSSFPSIAVIRPLKKSGELARLIKSLGENDKRYANAAQIVAEQFGIADKNISDAETVERVRGYVYLLRSGRRYKIGKSNDPSRRYREVRLELPDETHQVHTIPTDDPSGIEAYWHYRFSDKRVRNTEFFELNGADVRAFKLRKYQ